MKFSLRYTVIYFGAIVLKKHWKKKFIEYYEKENSFSKLPTKQNKLKWGKKLSVSRPSAASHSNYKA